MPERKPLTPREQLMGMCRVYLLIGAFLIGHAIYKYVEYTKFDEKPGFKLMSDWSAYVRLYEWGGKGAVVAFILILAAVFLTVSAASWRKLRKMPPESAGGR